MYGRPAGAVGAGDLSETLSMLAISEDSFAVESERRAADRPAFQTSTAHAGAHSLDNQQPFQLCHRGDDGDDRSAERTGCVEFISK